MGGPRSSAGRRLLSALQARTTRGIVTFTPSRERVEGSNLTRLAKKIAAKHDLELSGAYDRSDYEKLHRWSITEPELFWSEAFEDLELPGTLGTPERGPRPWRDRGPPGATWFPDAEVNHAECLLQGHGVALWESDETTGPQPVSYDDLRLRVAVVAKQLRDAGVSAGDAVAGVVKNDASAVVAMLATTSLGASWSSVAPDLGEKAAADRINAVGPKIVFASKEAMWRGVTTDVVAKVKALDLPSVDKILVCDDDKTTDVPPPLTFERGPFDRPVYVMFSSGTTGPPKCLVQGFGATLMHAKEGAYQMDIQKETAFWYTSTSWMMWNWLIGVSLSLKGTGVLYDGDPFMRDLFQLANETNVSVFGASAGYYAAVELQEKPIPECPSLKVLGSTGSPCAIRTFDWAAKTFGPDVALVSTSGGTDLNGSLCTGNPWLPVRAGSLQSAGLGLDVDVRDAETGLTSREPGNAGELVVLSAFPSAPLYFKNDDPDHTTYRGSYFDANFGENIWRHGDWVERDDFGGFVIHGRSDATLNAGGVRIGSAEIYNALDAIVDVNACLVVPQPIVRDGRPDSRVILFLANPDMSDEIEPPQDVVDRVKTTLRTTASPRHVPAAIAYCPEIPVTTNGKKVEVAVARALAGRPVTERGALRNPSALDFFVHVRPHLDAIARAQAQRRPSTSPPPSTS